MTLIQLPYPSPPVLAPFDPTGHDRAHLRCFSQYKAHAKALESAQVGNGLPEREDVRLFIASKKQRPNLDTTQAAKPGDLVWVDPDYFVATSSYMDDWPATRHGISGFWHKTLSAGLAEHSSCKLWKDSMAPNEIEMSIDGSELYMRYGAGGRHRWAAWKLLGFRAVPVILVS